jgi:DUF1365 family protein
VCVPAVIGGAVITKHITMDDAPPWTQNLAQLLSLLWCMWFHFARGALGVLVSLFHPSTWLGERYAGVTFVTGRVHHTRTHPVRRAFSYPLRLALVDLDAPPPWFTKSGQAADHISADAARARCGADGRVLLLTSPWSFGYAQNPISVYYVYERVPGVTGKDANRQPLYSNARPFLKACAAEVTNTPWGERVVFDFDPRGQRVPKSLHVSPFMDAQGDWCLRASDPMEVLGSDGDGKDPIGDSNGDSNASEKNSKENTNSTSTSTAAKPGTRRKLAVHVNVVGHPVFGDYFRASFVGSVDLHSTRHARNERAGIRTLLKHACAPHRVAFWIYKQAAQILRAGVPLFPPPGLGVFAKRTHKRDGELVAGRANERRTRGETAKNSPNAYPKGGCPLRVTYREARGWPWKT